MFLAVAGLARSPERTIGGSVPASPRRSAPPSIDHGEWLFAGISWVALCSTLDSRPHARSHPPLRACATSSFVRRTIDEPHGRRAAWFAGLKEETPMLPMFTWKRVAAGAVLA